MVRALKWWGLAMASDRPWGSIPPEVPVAHPTPRLTDRFVDFAVAVCDAARGIPNDFAGTEIRRQLARAGMSPAANYAEAREAASDRDYVHKMKICLKELRETQVWLRVARGNGFRNADYRALEDECGELIAITITCVKKAKARF
jgi:four helix bundle protein